MMNTLSIVLLCIFLPIIFVGLLFIVYVILKSFYLKKYEMYLDVTEKFLTHEPYIDTLTALRTVDITLQQQEKTMIEKISSSSNDEIKINDVKIKQINESKEHFATKYIRIEENLKKITELKEQMFENLSNSRVFQCRTQVLEIDKLKKELIAIKKLVSEETKELINPITDFESKKYKYTKLERNIENEAIKWKEQIDNNIFSSEIDKRLDKIQQYLEKASHSVSIGLKDEAFSNFTLFKKQLFDIMTFGNYYENFYNTIFLKAHSSLEKVMDYISKVKKNLKNNLDNLNVNYLIEQAADELLETKSSFFKLDVSNTVDNIEKFYNTLLSVTFIVSTEINAYNFFLTYNHDFVQKTFIKAYEKLNEINQKIQKLLYIDKLFYWNLQDYAEELKLMCNNLGTKTNEIEEILRDENNSFTNKLNKYKQLLHNFYNYFSTISDVEKMISIFYTEGISQGLKYNNLRKLFIFGYSEAKELNIIMDIEDKEIISKIEKKKNEIESTIFSNSNYSEKELKANVDIMYNLMIKFVNTVMKKSTILKLFNIINSKYSYLRLSSNIYDKKISEIENYIHDGKYEIGLKNLIKNIKGEISNV